MDKFTHKNTLMCLTIKAMYLDQNHLFIDATFSVHDNMKNHTGACAIFGKDMIGGSTKGHRINTPSCSASKVDGVYKNMPAILWMRYFLEAQGYPFRPTQVYQDNLGGKPLKTNEQSSSIKRTRYMNIRYVLLQMYRNVNTLQLTTAKLMK